MLDTKWKSSSKIRGILALAIVIIVTIVNFSLFPVIGEQAQREYEELRKEYEEVNYWELISRLYEGCEAIYLEQLLVTGGKAQIEVDQSNGEAVDIESSVVTQIQSIDFPFDLPADNEDIRRAVNDKFDITGLGIDFYLQTADKQEKNTLKGMEELLEAGQWTNDAGETPWYQTQYGLCMVWEFDENGNLSVQQIWSSMGDEDRIVRELQEYNRTYSGNTLEYCNRYGNYSRVNVGKPVSVKAVFGIPVSVIQDEFYYGYSDWWLLKRCYANAGAAPLYIGSVAALLLAMLLLSSNRIWRGTITWKRPGILYGMEAAILAVGLLPWTYELMVNINEAYCGLLQEWSNIEGLFKNGNWENIVSLLMNIAALAVIYGIWYAAFLFLRPVFSLGIREYVKRYSLIYAVVSRTVGFLKRCWRRLLYEVHHIDFSKKSTRTIGKIVAVNFVILALISCFWFFGIIVLIFYSAALFFLLKWQYGKVQEDYQHLLAATSRIGEGNLDAVDTEEDWGIFEPFKEELARIRGGFSAAVKKEVKSQRMKTELITNVSHDLKTPLTAITTYVELLKNPELTEEERKSYVETLERKSLRLKALIEDLFEASRASSRDIRLDLMEVDVVNLLKQVSVEHEGNFIEKELTMKWSVPEEKVTLLLDNQKSYRIFDNLFTNIEKYAMPGSRVYVDVTADAEIRITLKNMSAMELNIRAEELTDRFVRGDASRNTEGSGLGLAIAKSFTEAQKGSFLVEVDGDLFKVTLVWNREDS